MIEIFKNHAPGLIGEHHYHKTSVLVPFLEVEGQSHILFEVRSLHLQQQPGEICFPGGKMEIGEQPVDTALRETYEELLLKPAQIELVGQADIFFSPYNLIVYPFIGRLKDYQGTYSLNEVAEVFTVPLSYFLETKPQVYVNKLKIIPHADFPYNIIPQGEHYPWRAGQYPVYFYQYEGRVIWGITAMIIKSVTDYLK